MRKIGFGGGCHWCTEAVFQSLLGVSRVEQGWIASDSPNDTFSEGVIVHFDSEIDLETLVEVHLLTHSSTAMHSMRNKYRSAVYFFDEQDYLVLENIINNLSIANNANYTTLILPFVAFRDNNEKYLDYYKNDKQKPFCQTFIEPKLAMIRARYGKQSRRDF